MTDHPSGFDPDRAPDAHPAPGIADTDAAEPRRRDFLSLLTVSAAGLGAGVGCWPFLASLGPPAGQTMAPPPRTTFDLRTLRPDTQVTVSWNHLPVFVSRRGPDALAALQQPAQDRLLVDPRSEERQQPAWAQNWHRSAQPEFGVVVGICTHLGCVPRVDAAAGGPDGLLCPCHGSRYDAAGRVFDGSPAQFNLPVPPYTIQGGQLVLGADPPGGAFDFGSIRRL